MIVFPLRRSVRLKAATASSRVETLPMFVRSRPSRTRSERPIPGDRVPDAFRSLIGAHGAALALVAAYLSRAGTWRPARGLWRPTSPAARLESSR
jgi:hypothetical protein